MPAQYWERLQSDYTSLGLSESTDSHPPTTYIDIDLGYTYPTRDLFRNPNHHLRTADRAKPIQTGLGARLKFLATVSLPATSDLKLRVCDAAETYLLLNTGKSVSEAMVQQYGASISPLVVTRDEEPVAIVKGFSEPSVYGLADAFEWGIVSGVFSETAWLRVPRSDHPWSMNIAELGVSQPVRLSQYAIPVAERRLMRQGLNLETTSLKTSHADIVERAARLLERAQPISAEELRQPVSYRPRPGQQHAG